MTVSATSPPARMSRDMQQDNRRPSWSRPDQWGYQDQECPWTRGGRTSQIAPSHPSLPLPTPPERARNRCLHVMNVPAGLTLSTNSAMCMQPLQTPGRTLSHEEGNGQPGPVVPPSYHHIRNHQLHADRNYHAGLRTLLHDHQEEFAPCSTYMGDSVAMTDFTIILWSIAKLMIGKEHSRTIVPVSSKLLVDMTLGLDYPGLLLPMNTVRDQCINNINECPTQHSTPSPAYPNTPTEIDTESGESENGESPPGSTTEEETDDQNSGLEGNGSDQGEVTQHEILDAGEDEDDPQKWRGSCPDRPLQDQY